MPGRRWASSKPRAARCCGQRPASAPSQLHPIFVGSYDWHSSVHQHWTVLTVARWSAAGAPRRAQPVAGVGMAPDRRRGGRRRPVAGGRARGVTAAGGRFPAVGHQRPDRRRALVADLRGAAGREPVTVAAEVTRQAGPTVCGDGAGATSCGGGGGRGIRTLETRRSTRFRGGRTRPDYAIPPEARGCGRAGGYAPGRTAGNRARPTGRQPRPPHRLPTVPAPCSDKPASQRSLVRSRRRSAKNARNRSAAASTATPRTTSTSWLRRGSRGMS